ncbi:hypothetical protein MMC10_009886 [Thelotrema lepadinum]|nr:hypothetical protein [Thelotrema lepadinum]
MKSSFAARRKARAIGQEDEPDVKMEGTEEIQGDSVVKRPSLRAKQRPSSRVSFGPGASTTEDSSEIFTPKKSNLSRQATERNAIRKSALAASLSSSSLPVRQQGEDRPSYSKEFLAELRDLTPTSLQDVDSTRPEPETQALDIASKFGSSLARYESRDRSSAIPTEAEIQEKKARRARLAKEAKYKPQKDSDASSEEDDEDDFPNQRRDSDEDEFRTQHDRINLTDAPAKDKYPETRLDHSDEDLLEDYDAFVSDGRVNIGRKAAKEAAARQREAIAEAIRKAENPSLEDEENGNSSTDSEKEAREEYEAAQTRRGIEGLALNNKNKERDRIARPRTPPKITPVSSVEGVVEKLRARIELLERGKREKLEVLEGIEKEKNDIQEREGEVQRLLNEAGERYEALMREAGVNGVKEEKGGMDVQRELESLKEEGGDEDMEEG